MLQQLCRRCVTDTVAGNLLAPEVLARTGPLEERAIMAVPETAMHEDCRAPSRQHDVGTARESPIIEPETESAPMQTLSYDDLGARVSAPDACHHPAARGGINDVRSQSAAFAE
jgi:hypothetical protein